MASTKIPAVWVEWEGCGVRIENGGDLISEETGAVHRREEG